ncbi:MAG TPA: hypothetical protein VK190_12030, partial [Pseudoneobacillus sp.]|nr:hypothetical protein [Pseudoneobacillus sp.]
PYHSNEVPREYFKDKANRQDAVIWLLNKIRENGKKVKDLDIETVDQYGLYTLLHYYDNSLFLMLNEFFEGKTKPWIMKDTCTHEYWKSHPDIAKEGILYLIEQVGLTKETIPQLTLQHFRDHYLDKMLYSNYNGLIFSAINDVYPNEYIHLKWAFHDIPPQVFHVKENRQEAIQDLVRKMNLKKEEIPLRVTKETLLEHRFDYMLNHVHKGNVFLVINEAFPQQFNKDEFTGSTDSIEEYIDIFKKGNPSKLSFSDITEDGIKKGFAKLNEIFTVNTNSWVGQRKSQPFSEKIGELELSLYKELVKGNLSIYEFEYEEPEEPKEEGEEFIFNRLTHHSRARYSNVVWLYWRAYHFFKRFHLHLQLDSVYMGLGKEDCINTNDYEYEGDDIELETTIDRYRSIVRCGELEPYRLYSELYSGGVECVWVFPFEEEFYLDDEEVHNESSKSTKAYLLQFHHDARVSFVNKMMNKSIEPLYIM